MNLRTVRKYSWNGGTFGTEFTSQNFNFEEETEHWKIVNTKTERVVFFALEEDYKDGPPVEILNWFVNWELDYPEKELVNYIIVSPQVKVSAVLASLKE